MMTADAAVSDNAKENLGSAGPQMVPAYSNGGNLHSSSSSMDCRSSTSKKIDGLDSMSRSCRLIVAHWSCPVLQMLRPHANLDLCQAV